VTLGRLMFRECQPGNISLRPHSPQSRRRDSDRGIGRERRAFVYSNKLEPFRLKSLTMRRTLRKIRPARKKILVMPAAVNVTLRCSKNHPSKPRRLPPLSFTGFQRTSASCRWMQYCTCRFGRWFGSRTGSPGHQRKAARIRHRAAVTAHART